MTEKNAKIRVNNKNSFRTRGAGMMRRILAIVMGIFLSVAFCGIASAIPMSNTDLWDTSQGTTIIGSSPCQISPSNMFGNISGTNEPSNTIFGDQEIVSWVEWRTPEPITLAAFNLVASHDDRPTDIYQIRLRGFSHFRLYTGDGQGDWNLIYEYITDPDGDGWYGGGINYPGKPWLELYTTIDPVVAQYFRAEFCQFFSVPRMSGYGPRVQELDGYGPAPVPEPSTILLVATGLVGVMGIGRKFEGV